LIGIAKNVLADHFKKAAKERVTADSMLADSTADQHIHPGSNPPEADEQASQAFAGEWATMPSSVQEVMELAFEHSLSTGEIAKQTGFAESTIEKYKQRGKSLLIQRLKET
jgi:DNA-directed RNA polymerase specialized sigma24 family protein